ncbi:hypothetical protein B0T17DRAFT_613113 [Bombardia bombarda]|uniref:Uncharacterized protein n=1 Tax=Bombardia bombarda TaxID=252184 RepID=A0AA39XN75_9PEZI|nr:hypothetical protein B0T17DRAFT_613113 [Bombardia bombarda]
MRFAFSKGSTAIYDILTQLAYSDYPSEMALSDSTITITYFRVIHARIREIHTRTLSCTMVVDILDDGEPPTASSTAFLKLFDRRFADQLRRDNGIELWTKDMEQAYIWSVESG